MGTSECATTTEQPPTTPTVTKYINTTSTTIKIITAITTTTRLELVLYSYYINLTRRCYVLVYNILLCHALLTFI